MAKLGNDAGQEEATGQVVGTLGSTACCQPGEGKLRMRMEQGWREDRRAEGEQQLGEEAAAQHKLQEK